MSNPVDAAQRFASVNIDLDGLDCYHAIHGLGPAPDGDPIHGVALGRYLELLDGLGIHSTLFVITRYLERPATADALRAAAGQGHELASHTHGHPYDLGTLSDDAVAREIDAAAEGLEALTSRPPVGFRAPGYSISDRVLAALTQRGYRYDSSVFPCPPYYLAKAVVMAALRLTGRPSGSSLTDPRGLLAPIQPYRPRSGRFHRPARQVGQARPIWEIPMAVVPGLRLPIIGTSLALFGSRRFRAAYGLIRRRHRYLNLEFHGIDFLGPGDPGVTASLLDRQPDLRRPVSDKLRTYREVLSRAKRDYLFGTLVEMCDLLDRREASGG